MLINSYIYSSLTVPNYEAFINDVKLLLHFNGTNGSTTYTQNALPTLTVTRTGGGASISTAAAKFDQSGRFGSSSYVTVSPSAEFDFLTASLESWTIEFWVRLDAIGATQCILSKGSNSGTQACVLINVGTTGFPSVNVYQAAPYAGFGIASTVAITAGSWNHIAAMYNALTRKLAIAVNGTYTLQATTLSASTFFGTTADLLRLSGYSDSLFNFDGYLDDLRITRGQVLYTGNFVPPSIAFKSATTFDAANTHVNLQLTNNSLTATKTTSDAYSTVLATVGLEVSTANHYFEVRIDSGADSPFMCFGLAPAGHPLATAVGNTATSYAYYQETGNKLTNTVLAAYGSSSTTGDIIGVAVKNGSMWVSKNGSWFNSGDPVTNANPMFTGLTGVLYPAISLYRTLAPAHAATANFHKLSYLPSNFKPWIDVDWPALGNSLKLFYADGEHNSASFIDRSPSAKTITVIGSDVKFSNLQAYVGATSARFLGTASYLRAASSPDFQIFGGDFNITFWAYFNDVVTNQCLLQLDSGVDGNRASISVLSSTIVFFSYASGDSAIRISAAAPSLSTWTKVALRKAGSTIQLLINDVEVGTTTTSFLPTGNLFCSIGSTANAGGTQYFNGYIDRLSVTKGYADA